MALSIWTVTFEDAQVNGAARYDLDVFATDVQHALTSGIDGFRAMGADTGRWAPIMVTRKVDQSL